MAALIEQISEVPVTDSVYDYARQIWLAGLGALSKAEKEGNRLFETLAKRGAAVEAQARKVADSSIEEVRRLLDELRSKIEEMRGQAVDTWNDTWNKLEQVFQERVARALNRLGVPSRADIQDLAQQVEALSESIRSLTEAAETKPAARKVNLRSVAAA